MTMNLFGKKSSQNDNYKSRLEHKLYLARENPEPIFDLSECNLKSVPSGIYSLCKVFRKEKLFLQVNQLSSLSGGGQLSDLHLLTHLDLHHNHFSFLPEEIGLLINLQVLNISFNSLKKLPEAIGSLLKLRVLDCSNNKLTLLPSSIKQLTSLTTCDLRGNPKLSVNPALLDCTSSIQNILIDQNMTQPLPADRTQDMCCKIDKNDRETSDKKETSNSTFYLPKNNSESSVEEGQVQGSLMLLEKKKEEKQKELLEIEKHLLEQKVKEFEKHESIKRDKNKLLLSLKEQQKKLEDGINRFHTQKEEERARLLTHLLEVEKQSDERIEDLISLNQALRNSINWQNEDPTEKQLWEDYKIKNYELRRKEILDAMESLLAEECSQKKKLLEYENSKSEVIQNSLLKEVEWNEQVCWLVNARDARQSALVSAVVTDTEVQKALVATLLERSDLKSRSLIMQVALIQHQLAVLTDVELQRRKMDCLQQMNDLAEKRKTLSDLLVELLKEQQERRSQLTNQLQELEIYRQNDDSSTDYWLKQYQRLLDLRPPQMRVDLDPKLVHEVVRVGAAHCLPFLCCCDIENLTELKLSEIGVTKKDDQVSIMKAVTAYLAHKQEHYVPSAPPPEDIPTAPPRELLSECVVCMESQCDVVFVPCGHLCTCTACASKLLLCPLCRASLQRKIHILQ